MAQGVLAGLSLGVVPEGQFVDSVGFSDLGGGGVGLKEIAAATKKVYTLESEVKSLKPTVQTHTKEITALKAKK